MTYKDVYGQKNTVDHLKKAVTENKISHAYLFIGEDGSGKKMLAQLFAESILCTEGSGEPCGHCISCKQAASFNNPDLCYITHEKPNIISVDEIRAQLNSDIVIKPYEWSHKVYIIDEAEKMNEQAQNAILKTIEEPPEYAVIILLVTNEKQLLPTILSRCVKIYMRPVEKDLIKKILMEKHGISGYMADIAATFADGVPGRAVDFAASEDFSALKDSVVSLMKQIHRLPASKFPEIIAEWGDKELINERLQLVNMWYRDVLVAKSADDPERLLFKDEESDIYKAASELEYSEIDDRIRAVSELKDRFRANVNPDASLMLFLLKLRKE